MCDVCVPDTVIICRGVTNSCQFVDPCVEDVSFLEYMNTISHLTESATGNQNGDDLSPH